MTRKLLSQPSSLLQIVAISAIFVCLVSARAPRTSSSSYSDFEDEEVTCPFECDCSGFTVDCSNRELNFVPKLPKNAKKVHLGGNNIGRIRREDFLGLSSVRILDLRQNEIMEIEDASFQEFSHLDELILFQNKLKEIRPGMFKGLKNVKTLLLNANNISSIWKDTFSGFHNLHLLSLYDNNIETIQEGTFDPLHNIQTLHLGKNRFKCDCHLQWMPEYLNKYPIETTGARCETPKKLSRQKIASLDAGKFQCNSSESASPTITTDEELFLGDIPSPVVVSKEDIDLKSLMNEMNELRKELKQLKLDMNVVAENVEKEKKARKRLQQFVKRIPVKFNR